MSALDAAERQCSGRREHRLSDLDLERRRFDVRRLSAKVGEARGKPQAADNPSLDET